MSTLKSTLESLSAEFAASVLRALRSASLDELVGGASAPAATPAPAPRPAARPAARPASRPAARRTGRAPARAAKAKAAAPPAAPAPVAVAPVADVPAAPVAAAAPVVVAPAATVEKAEKKKPSRKLARSRLARRSPEDIQAVVDSIVELLSRHPDGLRSEDIRDKLGLGPNEMPRPLTEGLRSKKLSKEGEKRSTRYFVRGTTGKKK